MKSIVLKFLFINISLLYFGHAISQKNEIKIPGFKFKYIFKKDTLDIRKFGAVGDGVTLNTKAINDAIKTCSQKGGGVVLIPEGLWLTGPIKLLSNVNLHVQTSATLIGTKDFNQYQIVATNWEGLPQMRNQSLIYAENERNIAITGSGIIDGNGDEWRMVKKGKLSESQWNRLLERGGVLSDDKKTWYPSIKSKYGASLKNPGVISEEKNAAFYDSVKDFLRPNMIVLNACKNILLDGVIFQNSPAWCIHPMLSENIQVKNIKVRNPWYAQNGDGIDVESCKNVTIQNSIFDVGDDALCMKSGRDEAGRKRNKPTENVFIQGCTVYASHGGFVIGSEMSGGVKNITVEKCTFIGTDIGLRFKSARGRGGVVENIFIKDIFMKDIVGEAILFDMYYNAKDPVPASGEKRDTPKIEFKAFDESTPQFRNFHISRVNCDGAQKAIFIRGLPEAHISEIELSDINIRAKEGIDIQESSFIKMNNVKVVSDETNPVVSLFNCNNIQFNKLQSSTDVSLMFLVRGRNSSGIISDHTDFTGVKEKYKLESVASPEKDVFIIR